ncbi:helix-turn-helix domain-containing protein [Paenibacillus sp. GYB003]|uniref:helix-turn-helix domain-containing protein n=1 Tax=Paenibacillus sp. GYB003 TaxID=2994392 RepID=UPI003FA74C2D
MRIEVAKELLRTSGLPIGRISKQVGYKTAPYFCDLFFERTGMTSEQYLRSSGFSIAEGNRTN